MLLMPVEKASKGKEPTTVSIKVLSSTAKGLHEIGEAKGIPLWQVLEDLLAAELPAAVKAIQSQLKRVRELKAKTAQIQEEARKGRGE